MRHTSSRSARALLLAGLSSPARCDDGPPEKAADRHWLWSTAYAVPAETTSEQSGYFSIVEGKDRHIYVGTAKYGANAYLVDFDPADEDDEGRRGRSEGDRHDRDGLRRAVQDPHPQQRRRQRSDLLRHQAGLSQGGGEARPTIPAAIRWSTTRPPAGRGSIRSPSPTRGSSASRPTSRAASPTSRPAPTSGRSRARTS